MHRASRASGTSTRSSRPTRSSDPGCACDHLDRRSRRDRAALLSPVDDREGGRVRPYSPLELAGRTSISARAAITATARWSVRCATRSSAIGHYFARGREHVRQALPVGLQAHRSRSCPRRRQVYGPVAAGASERSARRRAAIDHAGLSLPSLRRRHSIPRCCRSISR